MAYGPSPIIPFMLVATLALLVHGRSLMEDISLVSEAEDTAFTLILVIPVLVLLLVYFTTQSLILPLAVMLIIYTVSKLFLGPLVLVLIIYFLSVYAPSFESFQGNSYYSRSASTQAHHGRDRDEYGWGCLLIFVLFFALHGILSEGGGQWGLVLLAVLFFILTNFQNQ